ncbi:SH3 domain-containing protein [Notoacmeibacter ruber]|uniref:SH3b domain-containing protein n=1 Tax=Notoacmeibacter ruber TaxID=2670375 RepID=A0A3L7JC26_9HYPH|nr:hypothetical protein D8780_01550 [Notoacmeibacter ruber]
MAVQKRFYLIIGAVLFFALTREDDNPVEQKIVQPAKTEPEFQPRSSPPRPAPPRATDTKPTRNESLLHALLSDDKDDKGRQPTAPSIIGKAATTILYATTRLNVRNGPSTSNQVVGLLQDGTRITVGPSDGKWRQIATGFYEGAWVHGDYLADELVRQPAQIPARLVQTQPQRTGPIRSPMTGRCDCPYDRARNGSRCGGRSAYSRPGGRSPRCYFSDQ